MDRDRDRESNKMKTSLPRKTLFLVPLFLLGPIAARFLPVGGAYHYARSWLSLRAQTPTPAYTVRLKEEVAGPTRDGAVRRGVSAYYTHARRSDGSLVLDASALDGVHTRIIKRADGVKITTNNQTGAKTTVAVGQVVLHGQKRTPESNCLKQGSGHSFHNERMDGEETLHGYRTVKVVAGGQTIWYAPDLGCVMLQMRWVWPASNGMPPSVTTKTAMTIELGEPDESLFRSPPDFDELSPSEYAVSQAEFSFRRVESKLPPDKLAERRKKLESDIALHRSQYADADSHYWANRPRP